MGADLTGDPLTYDSVNLKFTANSNNLALIDEVENYGVFSELAEYP